MEYKKVCNSCRIEKPLDNFHFTNVAKNLRKNKCKICQAEYIKKYKDKNEDKLRDIWRKASRKYMKGDKRRNKTLSKYGLTKETYNDMFDNQKGLCKICKQNLTLVVDHCHSSNVVRGLLCNMCNVGLGCFNDDIERLQEAIKYLNCGVS
jgi:hypothetical protein